MRGTRTGLPVVGIFATTFAIMGAIAIPAQAQGDYPNRPIALVVPYAAGGGIDIMVSPELKAKLAADGTEPLASTPEEYTADIDKEETKWSAIVKKSGAKAQ